MADAAKKKVRFVGGTGEHKNTGSVYEPGSKTRFDPHRDVEVDAALASELLAGEGRFKGLKFEAADEPKTRS